MDLDYLNLLCTRVQYMSWFLKRALFTIITLIFGISPIKSPGQSAILIILTHGSINKRLISNLLHASSITVQYISKLGVCVYDALGTFRVQGMEWSGEC